ncbi:phage tail tape measure protein [Rhodoferax sp.]|uniref:phage tail tape measure protein n=1 Tax=Rhodoferax sp. TaxID=50421 RepID=UPI0028522BE0|nr:phage tail tape measure protein [Rhodoferax sp.]MDR3370720.1 phage tail tape measure protein [Rhodoferax sp.]
MSQLSLKYTIALVSDIGRRATEEAKVLEKAHETMRKATEKTTGAVKALEKEVVISKGNIVDLQSAITGATNKFNDLDRAMSRIGGNVGSRQQITFLNALKGRIDQATNSAAKLREGLNKAGRERLDIADVAAAGYGAKKVVTPFIKSYSSLEDAETGLKIAMMTKGGKVGGDYEAIKKIAVEQGNKLPGSTKDMTQAATELISLGITPEAVKNGGLVAATNLGVVLGIPQTQAAETTAKLREAYSLKDDELPAMADTVQRNRYAGGINPEELLMAAKYEAPIINALGMGGLKGMSDVLTVQGMANQKGMNGGEFGTNFAEMLTRLATGPLMVEEAKKGMKAEARDRMDALGIKFNFFDDKGKVKTLDGSAVKGIFSELEKFNLIKNKDGSADDKTRLEVAKALFGSEGGRPALIMAQAGLKGFEAARSRVVDQASLDERINTKLETFASKLESLGGTIENVMAHMGAQLGRAAKPVMDGANGVLGGGIDEFMQAHPTAGTVGIAGGAIGAALAALKSKALLFRLLGLGGGAAEGGAAAAAAGGISLGAAGAGAAGIFAGSQLWRVWDAFGQLSDAKNRDGVKLSPYALGRLSAMQQGQSDMTLRSAGIHGISPGMDFLTLTAPGVLPEQLTPGKNTEIKVGEGTLAIDVRVTDERISATPSVMRPLSLVRINPGATNPGGFKP